MTAARWVLALAVVVIFGLFGGVAGMFAGSWAGNWFGTQVLDIRHEGGLLFISAGIVAGGLIGYVVGAIPGVLLVRHLNALSGRAAKGADSRQVSTGRPAA